MAASVKVMKFLALKVWRSDSEEEPLPEVESEIGVEDLLRRCLDVIRHAEVLHLPAFRVVHHEASTIVTVVWLAHRAVRHDVHVPFALLERVRGYLVAFCY